MPPTFDPRALLGGLRARLRHHSERPLRLGELLPEERELPIWMHPVEHSQLLAIVESVAPRRVLEWGTGGSTRSLLARCPFIELYCSVEHHAEWVGRVREVIDDPRLHLHHVPSREPQPEPRRGLLGGQPELGEWFLKCERDPSIFAEYIDFPRSLGTSFDFVLVDGRARIHCLKVGYELLRPGGVMVIHDAQRQEYRETILGFPRATWLHPWKQGQICLIRRPDEGAGAPPARG